MLRFPSPSGRSGSKSKSHSTASKLKIKRLLSVLTIILEKYKQNQIYEINYNITVNWIDFDCEVKYEVSMPWFCVFKRFFVKSDLWWITFLFSIHVLWNVQYSIIDVAVFSFVEVTTNTTRKSLKKQIEGTEKPRQFFCIGQHSPFGGKPVY